MPMWYKGALTQTLNDAVQAHLDTDPAKQLALFDELALMRESILPVIKMYGAAVDNGKQETMVAAAALMRDQLREVATMCEAAARVAGTGKDKFSVHNLQYVVNQIVMIAYRVFKDHDDLAKEFERKIREEVCLAPELGTDITPDQDVLDMDDTVPNDAQST